MEPIDSCDTAALRLAYRASGPADGAPVLLLHGWPDEPGTWDGVVPTLHAAGFRTLVPWLRGFGPTRFRHASTPRSGEIAAMAQDMLDLADALGLGRFAVVGHDWGARIAYLLAATQPDRITHCAALSLGWSPGKLATPGYEQARAFWYQWFLATPRGEEELRTRGKAFARLMWDSWSPPGWFDDVTFDRAATAFDNPDWADITLHSYRVRWEGAPPDPAHATLARHALEVRQIRVPTLTIQGGDDRCILPSSSEGKEAHFAGPYERRVLDGVGHFPTREAPQRVAQWVGAFLSSARTTDV